MNRQRTITPPTGMAGRERGAGKAIRSDWRNGQGGRGSDRRDAPGVARGSESGPRRRGEADQRRRVAAVDLGRDSLLGVGADHAQAGIVSLHAVTSANARATYEASGDDDTRRMMLLQKRRSSRCSARRWASRGPSDRSTRGEAPKAEGGDGVAEIFAEDKPGRMAAATKDPGVPEAQSNAVDLIDAARLLCLSRGPTRTTTSTALPCWRTGTACHHPGASATWRRACSVARVRSEGQRARSAHSGGLA